MRIRCAVVITSGHSGDLFPPQAERLLRRAIRQAEEHRIVLSASCDSGAHDGATKMSRGPHVERRVADARAAVPFDDDEDRRVGLPIRRRPEARGQQLHERADRRHRVAAGRRIHEAHLDAVALRAAGPLRRSSSSVSRLREYG